MDAYQEIVAYLQEFVLVLRMSNFQGFRYRIRLMVLDDCLQLGLVVLEIDCPRK